MRYAALAVLILAAGAAPAAAQDAAGWAVGIGDNGSGQVTVMTARVDAADNPGARSTYLGVATSAASEALAEQLKLPKGTGLVVDFVDGQSPAAVATGIRRNDVLVRLDDQVLINPEQLAVLVKMRKPKDKVTLTLLREAKEQKVTVELGETSEAGRNALLPPQVPGAPAAAQAAAQAAVARQMANVVRLGQGGRAASSTSAYSDGEHTLTLTTTDGQKHLMVKDRAGDMVFNGPVNTPAQRKEVPPDVLKKLETMEGSMRIDVQGGGVARGIAVMNAGAGGIGMNILQGPGGAMIPFRAFGQPSGESRSWTDPEHCLTVTTRQTGKYLTVDNKNGKILWEGPIQTDAERQALPPEYLSKLEKMEEKARQDSRGTVSLIEDGLTVTLTTDAGKQTVVAKDADGKVLFEGPVDTEEQRAKMPAKVRTNLEKLWKSCAAVWQPAQAQP